MPTRSTLTRSTLTRSTLTRATFATLAGGAALLALPGVADARPPGCVNGATYYLDGGNFIDTPCNDVIVGSGTVDHIILAKGGKDVVHANGGGDTIVAANTIASEIHGGEGNDKIIVQVPDPNAPDNGEWPGKDAPLRAWGDGGSDTISGGSFADEIWGGEGNDFLYGGIGADDIFGGNGDDVISGFWNLTHANGIGNDDLVFGGYGNDHVNVRDGWGSQAYGGPGTDHVEFDPGMDVAVEFETQYPVLPPPATDEQPTPVPPPKPVFDIGNGPKPTH